MDRTESVEQSIVQLQKILKRLEDLQNEPFEPAALENMKMRIQIYGILLNYYK